MSVAAKRLRSYLRLETDAEFRARLLTLRRRVYDATSSAFQHGEALDDWAWEKYQAQRKLKEVEG